MRELRNTKIIAVDHGYEECCKLVLSSTITGNLIIRIFSR